MCRGRGITCQEGGSWAGRRGNEGRDAADRVGRCGGVDGGMSTRKSFQIAVSGQSDAQAGWLGLPGC